MGSYSQSEVSVGNFKQLKFWLILLFFAYILWVIFDEDINVDDLSSLPSWLIILLCSMTLFSFILRFLRWHLLLSMSGYKMPAFWHLSCYVSGFAFTATPGKLGETTRSLFLAQRGVPRANSLSLFVCDRFCDLFALMIWGLFFLGSQSLLGPLSISLLLILLFTPIFFISTPLIDRLILWCMSWIKKPLLLRALSFLLRMKQSLQFYLDPVRFLCCLFVGLCTWSLIGLELQLVLSHYGAKVSFVEAMGVTAAGLIAGAASLIPAGVGVNELVQSHLLTQLGVDQSVGKVSIFVARFFTLWLAIAVGGIALFLLSSRTSTKKMP